jgi:hypothetical protein
VLRCPLLASGPIKDALKPVLKHPRVVKTRKQLKYLADRFSKRVLPGLTGEYPPSEISSYKGTTGSVVFFGSQSALAATRPSRVPPPWLTLAYRPPTPPWFAALPHWLTLAYRPPTLVCHPPTLTHSGLPPSHTGSHTTTTGRRSRSGGGGAGGKGRKFGSSCFLWATDSSEGWDASDSLIVALRPAGFTSAPTTARSQLTGLGGSFASRTGSRGGPMPGASASRAGSRPSSAGATVNPCQRCLLELGKHALPSCSLMSAR